MIKMREDKMENGENENQELDDNLIDDLEELKDENGEVDKDLYIAKLNEHLNDQKKKADEYFEHLKRNMAEFDNFKKRMSKEKENLYITITSDVLADILPIIDNFEKAVSAETKDESFKDGMVMIYNQLNDTLKKFGLGGKLQVFKGKYTLDLGTGIYPEFMLSYRDGDFLLCGQIDLLAVDGNDIIILDHKTNKKVEFKSFYDKYKKSQTMMKYPLNTIQDCNGQHYTLQLSTYA